MNFIILANKLLWKDIRKYRMLIFTTIFAIASAYVFFDLMNYELDLYNGVVLGIGEHLFSTIFSLLVVVFCGFMIICSYLYFLKTKTKEFAVFTLSGATNLKATLYLIIQTFLIMIIAIPLGFLIGYVFAVMSRIVMSYCFSMKISYWQMSIETLINTFITIIVILFVMIMCSSGYIYRHNILALFNETREVSFKDKRLFRFSKGVYVVVYILGIYMILSSPMSLSLTMIIVLIGIWSAGGIIQYIVPQRILSYKKHRANSISLISLSYLSETLQKSYSQISLYSSFSVIMIFLLISHWEMQKDFIIILIGYFIIISLIIMSIMYKFISDSMLRGYSMRMLYQLGYSLERLKGILNQEIIGYFFCLLIIPFVYQIIILLTYYFQQLLSFNHMILLIVVIIVPLLMIAKITQIIYQKNILKIIVEGEHYES